MSDCKSCPSQGTCSTEKQNTCEITNNPLNKVKNIIGVMSGKGGVGKSTVTSLLGVSLKEQGYRVGVMDADVTGPSIPKLFGKNDSHAKANKKGIFPIKSDMGIKLMSINFLLENKDDPVIWRGPAAASVVKQFFNEVHWGELDYLLIDLPPGTGDVHLSIVQALPINGAVVVSTPQNIALADAKKGVAMFQQDSIKVPVLGIIENMAYFTPEELPNNKYYIFGKDGAKNLATNINTTFLGEIPLVQSIREAGDVGHPVALQEGTVLEKAFQDITKEMVSQ